MSLLIIAALLAVQEPAAQEKSMPPLPAAAAASKDPRNLIVIEPKSRAKDYAQAFELLRKEKPSLKINIQTSAGTLANVAELTPAENGTLMLVKVPFTQGTKYLIVPIEDIKEIAYSP